MTNTDLMATNLKFEAKICSQCQAREVAHLKAYLRFAFVQDKLVEMYETRTKY